MPVIKIADFGLAIKNHPVIVSKRVRCGTPGFAAPEILKGLSYDHKSDIFSLGAIIFKLASGRPLLIGSSVSSVLDKTKSTNFSQVIDRSRI